MATLCPKNPTISQSLTGMIIIIGICAWGTAVAQPDPWNEQTVVERALSNPDVQKILHERLRASDAAVAQQTVAQNPALHLAHEQIVVPDGAQQLEFSLSVEQPFDWVGWRDTLRNNNIHRRTAILAEHDEWKLAVTTEVRSAFFRVRYHEERVKTMEHGLARITATLAGMRARQDRGDIARYDVLRLEAEVHGMTLLKTAEEMELAEAWAGLRSWVPHQDFPRIEGALAPAPLSHSNDPDLSHLPQLRRIESLGLSAAGEADAWGDPFLRGWSIGAGYRLVHADTTTGHGFLVTLSIPLAFTNVDQPVIEGLMAEKAQLDHELRRQQTILKNNQEAATTRVDAALAALQNTPPSDHDSALSELAETAFAAGEITVTELVDAYASELDRSLVRIDLQWHARRAVIEKDHAYGVGVTP